MSKESMKRISEADMKRAQNTADFLVEQAAREEEINRFPTRTNKYAPWSYETSWPNDRAWHHANMLSKDQNSGISTQAYNRVVKMISYAHKINDAHDIITSDGRDVEPFYDSERIARRLRGNNSAGMEQRLGYMARAAGVQYDIKDGVAMRGSDRHTISIAEIAKVGTGYPLASSDLGNYRPYPVRYQESAKELIQGLGEKQMLAANKRERRQAVIAAKEVLGRAGVRIPKPYSLEMEQKES